MTLQISSTDTGTKRPFEPLGDPVGMYVCGMTPKDKPHIGHAFMFVQLDVIRRYLEYRGLSVRHIQNFTDVDDKIIERSRAAGREPLDYAREFTAAYFDVMDRLHVLRAHEFPTVSNSIDAIVTAIADLIERGHAYQTSQGVYFSVQSFPPYGRLSGRTEGDVEPGARVEVDPEKRDPRDFALWKRHKQGEIFWESPWGPGRPGWHIECSAMIRTSLGEQIDIHGGGADLIFPHHENEIAQAVVGTGRDRFVNHWIHTGLMLTDGKKMSHSLDNFTTVEALLEEFLPDVLRLYLLSVHYRTPLHFARDGICQSAAAYDRLLVVLRATGGGAAASDADADLHARAHAARAAFEAAMDDDFNAPRAIGAVFELGRDVNRLASSASQNAVATAQQTVKELLGVVGIELVEPTAVDGDAAAYIDLLIQIRGELRKVGQWQLADQIRAGLAGLGVVLEDTTAGTTWRRR